VSLLIVPDEAKINWAQAQIDDAPTLTDCYLRLFKSTLIIDSATTLAELEAVQADYLGYAPIQLENFSDAVIVDGAALTEPDNVTFEADEEMEGEIFGCYATNGAGDKLWFATLFDDPVPVPFDAELLVSIQLNLASILTPQGSVTMSAPVIPTSESLERLAALIALEYQEDPDTEIHLYKNDVEPDANMTPDTFVEADFTGYAAIPIAMNTPAMNDVNMVVSKSDLNNWATAGGVDPQVVYGIYITKDGGADLVAAQRFDEPQSVGGAFPQAVSGIWRISEPPSTYGWIDVEH